MFGLPANAFLSVLLVIILFNDKDLGATTHKIYLESEDGESIERTVVKSEFRKKIALFFFNNSSTNSELNWLQYAIPSMIQHDLSQNTFIQTNSARDFAKKFREAGYDHCIDAPFLLLHSIAKYYSMNYFITGTFTFDDGTYVFKTEVYKTKNASLVSTFDTKGDNVLSLIDQITEQLVIDIKIPPFQIENSKNLPVEEIYTKSFKALEQYTKGNMQVLLHKNWDKAIAHIESALHEDPNFALARVKLMDYYFNNNNFSKAEAEVNEVMKIIYNLPERMQFITKFFYYTLKQESDKAIAVLKMWTELFHEDIEAHDMLATRYQYKNMFRASIKEYEAILQLDPDQSKYIRYIGDLYTALGITDSAMISYDQYVRIHPDDYKGYSCLSELYLEMAVFDKALENIDKALILEPRDISLALTRLTIDQRLGIFDQLEQQHHNLLSQCPTIQDSISVLNALSDYYEFLGKATLSLQYYLKYLDGASKIYNPLNIAVIKMFNVNKYIIAGNEKTAFEVIQINEKLLEPPVDKAAAYGYMFYYIFVDSAEMAEPFISDARELAIGFGEEMLLSNICYVEGFIAEFKKDYETAVEQFNLFLEKTPSGKQTYRNLARCERKAGNLRKAKKNLEAALNYYPFSPKAHFEAYLLFKESGNIDKALMHLKLANEIWKDADVNFKPAKRAREALATYNL